MLLILLSLPSLFLLSSKICNNKLFQKSWLYLVHNNLFSVKDTFLETKHLRENCIWGIFWIEFRSVSNKISTLKIYCMQMTLYWAPTKTNCRLRCQKHKVKKLSHIDHLFLSWLHSLSLSLLIWRKSILDRWPLRNF